MSTPIRSTFRPLIRRAAVFTVAVAVVASLLTCAGTASSQSILQRDWDLLEAGPQPIAPPYADEDADAPYADAGQPFCDACAARAQ